MKIIVGLGNPGKQYEKTRHNAGFVFVEKLAGEIKFVNSNKFEADIAEVNGWLLVKPQTFMNNSGLAVRKILNFYKLDSSSLVIIHDDLDLPLGEYKIQQGVGPKVHNGVTSVEQHAGTNNFLRVRLGVDNRKNSPTILSGADYVLDDMTKDERSLFDAVVEKAVAELLVAFGL